MDYARAWGQLMAELTVVLDHNVDRHGRLWDRYVRSLDAEDLAHAESVRERVEAYRWVIRRMIEIEDVQIGGDGDE